MATLKKFLEAVDYRITGGWDFLWSCYGKDPRIIQAGNGDIYPRKGKPIWSASVYFDSTNQKVCEISATLETADMEDEDFKIYRWIVPALRQKYFEEEKKRGVANDPRYVNVNTENQIFALIAKFKKRKK